MNIGIAFLLIIFLSSCQQADHKAEEDAKATAQHIADSVQKVIEETEIKSMLSEATPVKKSVPKQKEEATSNSVEQWKEFRSNPDKYSGTKVQWKMKVNYVLSDKVTLFLEGDYQYYVDIPEYAMKEFPKVHTDDWLLCTGKFVDISTNGNVLIVPSQITNLGYRKD